MVLPQPFCRGSVTGFPRRIADERTHRTWQRLSHTCAGVALIRFKWAVMTSVSTRRPSSQPGSR